MSGTQLLLKVRYRLAINYVVWVSAEHKRTELAWGDILEYCLNPTPGARLPGNLTGSVSDRFHPKFNNVLDFRETGRDWKPKTFDRWLAHERFVDILQDCSLSTTKPFSKRPPFDRAKSLVSCNLQVCQGPWQGLRSGGKEPSIRAPVRQRYEIKLSRILTGNQFIFRQLISILPFSAGLF